jgi:hypothetical protein
LASGQAAPVNFGTVNIGSASATTAVTLTVSTAFTPGSVFVRTQGASGLDFANTSLGPCSAGSGGGSCLVNVTFTPKFAGNRLGAWLARSSVPLRLLV